MRPCQSVSKSFQGDKALVDSLQPPAEKKIEAAKILSVNGIYYTCPLSGEVIPKSDYVSHLETFLNSLEPVPSMETSVVKLNCLNTHRENREKAIEIIGKYLNNIKSNPDEEKYKKIKWNHKLFQEKVRSQKGATDFLKSIGWTEETLDGIPYLVYKGTLENIDQAMIALQTDEIPRPTLHRMPKLLSPTDGQQRVELPVSRQLFDLTRFRIFFLVVSEKFYPMFVGQLRISLESTETPENRPQIQLGRS
jgi:hypothetical protein